MARLGGCIDTLLLFFWRGWQKKCESEYIYIYYIYIYTGENTRYFHGPTYRTYLHNSDFDTLFFKSSGLTTLADWFRFFNLEKNMNFQGHTINFVLYFYFELIRV